MTANKKENKITQEDKMKIIFSCHADIIRTQYSDKDILIEFGESPPDDDGYVQSCRVYSEPEGIKDIIESLNDVLKKYNKHSKKNKK